MHTANLVAFDAKRIHVSRALLAPISIHKGSELYGLHYTATGDAANHDFIFTPVPPRLWPYVARLEVLIKHNPGALEDTTRFLRENQINILTAQCTRSGYRYASLTLTVAFDRLWTPDLDIEWNHQPAPQSAEEAQALRLKVKESVAALVQDIRANLSQALISDADAAHIGDPVYGTEIRSLSYFHELVLTADGAPNRPFPVVCTGETLELSTQGEQVLRFFNIAGMLPAYGFASMSTRDFNLRIALIPNANLGDFARVKVHYDRRRITDADNTSRGLSAKIAEHVAMDKLTVWSLYNRSTTNTRDLEEGIVEFVARRTNRDKAWNGVEKSLSMLRFTDNLKINAVSVEELIRVPIFLSMKYALDDRERIIEACHEEGRRLGILKGDFVMSEGDEGLPVTQNVLEKMKQCKGMLQFFVVSGSEPPASADAFTWLNMEAFAAHMAGVPYVRIVDETIKDYVTVDKDNARYTWTRKNIEGVVREALTNLLERIT